MTSDHAHVHDHPSRRRASVFSAAAVLVLLALVAGCSHAANNKAGLTGVTQSPINAVLPTTSPDTSTGPTDPASPTPSTAATTAASTSTPTSHALPVASVSVTAVTGSYTGLCAPPSDATTYRAVISVNRGPATVTFRWTTSNGGDSDPSTQTYHFTGTGHQTHTVLHHEAFYPPGPYPAHTSTWVAVNLISPTSTQSNHASLTMSCVPFTVHVTKVSGDYTGSCPPPGNAVKFSADIVADAAADVTIKWHVSNGGDSSPNPVAVHLSSGVNTVVHSESMYPGGPYPKSLSDWVELDVTAGAYTAKSNHVTFAIHCTS